MAAPKCRQNMGSERTYPFLYTCLSWIASARVRALTLKQIRITTDILKQLLAFAPAPSVSATGSGFDWFNSVGTLLTQLYNLSDSLLDGYREEIDVRRLSGGSDTDESSEEALRQAFLDARTSVVEPFRLVMTSQHTGGMTSACHLPCQVCHADRARE